MSFTYSIVPGADLSGVTGGSKLRPNMTIAEIDRLATALPSYNFPKSYVYGETKPVNRRPFSGKARNTDAIAEDYARLLKTDNERANEMIGKWISDSWRLVATDGNAAVLAREGKPADVQPATHRAIAAAIEAPVTIVLTADEWSAYARVRTCKPDNGAVAWNITRGLFSFGAEDLDVGCVAREAVTAHVDPTIDERSILLADRYVWPLRGLGCVMRQAIADGPVAFTYSENRAIVIMPMREKGGH